MSKIIPALLVDSVEEFYHKLRIVRQLTNRLQLDVIDGEYVDNKSVEPAQLGRINDLKIDAHLMVVDHLRFAKQCIKLGCGTIIIQFEAGGDIAATVDYIKSRGPKAGLAINPATKVEAIAEYLPRLGHVLVMAYPAGFAGQPFESRNLAKIGQLRKLKPGLEIGWDGAVDNETAAQIAQAGADVINVNSYIFKGDQPMERYSKLLEAVQ